MNAHASRAFRALALVIVLCATRLSAADWWKLSDQDFIAQYKNLALGTPDQRSQFAWMLFARINQPDKLGDKTFTVWELWPSNDDTFSPAVRLFNKSQKVRTRPHLQEPKVFLMNDTPVHAFALAQPQISAGEEVTRNPIAYGYITDPKRPLNTRAAVVAAINGGKPIDMPIAAIEIKADWTDGAATGMYQVSDGTTSYGLDGLHIMVKIAPDPKDVQSSPDPSWFWTTFEFKGNSERPGAMRFITNPDTLPAARAQQILAEAGLSGAFTNYLCNGTQTSFVTPQGKDDILGNTTMEAAFAIPQGVPSAKWTSWVSSCHTCHGEASAKPLSKTKFAFPFSSGFKPEVGKITGIPAGYTPLDFNMSILFRTR